MLLDAQRGVKVAYISDVDTDVGPLHVSTRGHTSFSCTYQMLPLWDVSVSWVKIV